jgi:uncharacterized protein (TIGR03067 family)
MNLWRWSALVIVALCVHAGAGAAPVPAALASEDLKKLAGAWHLVRFVRGGEAVKNVYCFFRIEGSRWTFTTPGIRGAVGTIKLNVKRKPKEFDATFPAGKNTELWRGVYHLDGDTLTIRYRVGTTLNKPVRPRSVHGTIYEVYRRTKPATIRK